MSDPVPVYEAKNRFPFYLHQAEVDGPVRITRHDKTAGYLISEKDFKKLKSEGTKMTFMQSVNEWRQKYIEDINAGMFENISEYFENLHDTSSEGSKGEQDFLREICQ